MTISSVVLAVKATTEEVDLESMFLALFNIEILLKYYAAGQKKRDLPNLRG